MNQAAFQSVFTRVFDLIVIGGGYAGFAAAEVARRGGQSVLLVERQAALLWESGWAFYPDAGQSEEPAWKMWLNRLKRCGGASDSAIDGAIAEVQANEVLREAGIESLYYATPLAAEMADGLLRSLIVGTKGGCRRLAARRWVDASDTGELAALCCTSWRAPAAESQVLHLHMQRQAWPDGEPRAFSVSALPGAEVRWEHSLWPNERRVRIELPGDFCRHRSAWVPALQAAYEELGDAMTGAVLTHGSVIPFCRYEAGAQRPANLPENVVCAIAALDSEAGGTLAGRYGLGVGAAAELGDRPAGPADEKILEMAADFPRKSRELETEVAVAGIGTGGGLAAVAAARAGAAVTAFDPLPFAGGIGSGGGIHWYYYGVKGGLQEELDERCRQIQPLFGASAQIRGFHPDAKKVVLDDMLAEAGVRLITGATLVDVQRSGTRITHGLLASPKGAMRLKAGGWIDATGDGDLAVRGGASYHFGRSGDGLIHAYSQSSGRTSVKNDATVMSVVNYDAGFVDPTDAEDLTRGRRVGISHYAQRQYDPQERPTYIAPAIGLR
jgi:hypothetical protein